MYLNREIASMAPGLAPATVQQKSGNSIMDMKDIQLFKPPPFTSPYPLHFNSEFTSTKCHKKVEQWLLHLKVDKLFGPKLYSRFLSMDILGLLSRVYTEPVVCGVEWVCKYVASCLFWDDCLVPTNDCPEKTLLPLLEVHLTMMWSFPDDPVLRTQVEALLSDLHEQERDKKFREIDSMLAEARNNPGKGDLYI
jgi:hypothetical protein